MKTRLIFSQVHLPMNICVAVCCSVLQCVAVCCSVLQCVAVCCSVLQCVASTKVSSCRLKFEMKRTDFGENRTFSVKIKHTATHWHCNTLTLQHTATHYFGGNRTFSKRMKSCESPTATHCNTLQHTATQCNTLALQHTDTATHCNTLLWRK